MLLQRLFRRRSFEQEIDEELQAHLDIEVKLLKERGLSEDQARDHARRVLGNRTLAAERSREAWGLQWMDMLRQDLHYAARSLRKSPSFTVAAALSLALGVGASTAVFSIADTVFLRPLPYANPERLLWVAVRFPGIRTEFLASPDYVAWRSGNHVFENLAATQFGGGEPMLLNGLDAREVHAVRVSANFLQTFGIRPALGRGFLPGEELPNGPKAVLISDQLWRQDFRAARDITGKVMRLDGEPYTIAGVLPARFVFPMDVKADVMTTLPVSPTASHHDRSMSTWAAYGRLKPGVTMAQARANLQTLFERTKADLPLMFRSDTWLVVKPLQEHRAGDARTLLRILLGASACLLLIACANVSNLMLGRWSARSGELAVRAAIGAGRGRLARQLFTEAALLTLISSFLASGFLFVMLKGFVHYAAGELPRLAEVSIDYRLLLIGVVVATLTTVALGMLPALSAGRVDIRNTLEGSGRAGNIAGLGLLKRLLVVAEVAISLVLLAGAALMWQTLWHLKNDQLGFEPEHEVSVTIPVRGTRIAGAKLAASVQEIVEFARQMPGTIDAAWAGCTPLSRGMMMITFSRSDRPLPEAFHRGDPMYVCETGPGYAKAAGIRLIRGRYFTDEDEHHPNTLCVINQSTMRAYFHGEDPIGKRILGGPGGEWKTVIGVVSDSKNLGLDQPAGPQAFVNGVIWSGSSEFDLVMRSAGNPQVLTPVLLEKLRALDPGLIAHFETLDETIDTMSAGPRFNTILLAGFSAIAFLMAVVGVYGVLSFSITGRIHDIGIRVALGAQPRRVFARVLGEGVLLALVGGIIGLAGAWYLNRYLKAMLYGISATDFITLAAVTGALVLAAGVAACIPARRAASVDPMRALRHY